MTIKSDKWIQRKIESKELVIEPFLNESVNNINGKKVPSFGLTSYGYDIRLGRNFKIARHSDLASPHKFFTDSYVRGHKVAGERDSQVLVNIKPYEGDYIDVCEFDDKFFVDLNDVDEIIIPPQGFILGHSFEKLAIPKNVSAVCMGKSTIARSGLIVIVTPLEPGWCFTGDTEVALANGESVSFRDMVKRSEEGERFFGYTYSKTGYVEIAELLNPRKIKEKATLVEVQIDNGEKIRCTPDHKFLLKDGSYIEAKDLKENDTLMPLYRYKDKKGYESVSSPTINKTRPVYTHKLADDWNIKNNIYQKIDGHVRHHVDFNPSNNYPTNIVRMTDKEHHLVHETKEGYKEERSKIARESWGKFVESMKDVMNFQEILTEMYSRRSNMFWQNEENAEQRKAWIDKHKEPRPYRYKVFDRIEIFKSLIKYGSIRQAAINLKTKADTLVRRFPDLIAQARTEGYIPLNHKVVSVTELDIEEDVYCLTVPVTNNFALDAGIFVHNCGYVTLEIFNTLRMPVRLRSGIGITQVQFFESDEECSVSYADRNGKYQNQPALPVSPKN